MRTASVPKPAFNHIDVIVIGGGVAGCYTAYRLYQQQADLRVLIIEAADKLGGRTQTDTFCGVSVTPGAGFGRFDKDALLRRLMKELKFPVSAFNSGHVISTAHNSMCHVEADFKKLRRQYIVDEKASTVPLRVTFKEYASRRLSDYDGFVACTGFSDFENADASDVFFHYGFEDNYLSWPAFMVPWSKLISAMTKKIPYLLDTCVQKIRRTSSNTFVVTCADAHTASKWRLRAVKVVITTDVDTLYTLLPAHRELYKHIHGQPFLKIYGSLDTNSAELLASALPKTGLVVLPASPLQKILRISDTVYLIAYSDNKNALALRRLSRNDAGSRQILCRLIELAVHLPANSLRLRDTRGYFWMTGTHYFDPFAVEPHRSKLQFVEAAQRPEPGVFVAGECVAFRQGWVEGALESVENILNS